MGTRTVRFSDLTNKIIDNDAAVVRVVVEQHPALENGPVKAVLGGAVCRRDRRVITSPHCPRMACDIHRRMAGTALDGATSALCW